MGVDERASRLMALGLRWRRGLLGTTLPLGEELRFRCPSAFEAEAGCDEGGKAVVEGVLSESRLPECERAMSLFVDCIGADRGDGFVSFLAA